jgi:hypothetical protein
MADENFVLYTICPVGHAIPFRRKLSTWRLSLDAPAVVLWCYECGLEWPAEEHDRAAVAAAVRRVTAVEGEPRAENVSDRDLKTRAGGSAGACASAQPRLGVTAHAASGFDGRSIAFTTNLRQRGNRHRCQSRACGSWPRSMPLFAAADVLRGPCRGRQGQHGPFRAIRSHTPAANATASASSLSRATDSKRSRLRPRHQIGGRARDCLIRHFAWGRLWWAPTVVGVVTVGLLMLVASPQRGFVSSTVNEVVELRTSDPRVQGVGDAIVTESARGVQRPTPLEERVGTSVVMEAAALVQSIAVPPSLAAPALPIRRSAESGRANPSPAAVRKPKGAASKPAVALVAQVPAGTVVPLSLETPVPSTTLPGMLVRARVRDDVVVRKQVLIPRGSILDGRVTSVERPQSRWISALKVWEFGKRRSVVLSFTTLRTPGSTSRSYRIRTAPVAARAKSASHRRAIPAAVATVTGAIVAGPLGAAGGGIAARAVARSIDDGAQLPAGTPISAQILDRVEAQ